jgi:hypothetical protein
MKQALGSHDRLVDESPRSIPAAIASGSSYGIVVVEVTLNLGRAGFSTDRRARHYVRMPANGDPMDVWHDRVPFADTTAFVFILLIWWSIGALNSMFDPIERPPIFLGRRGDTFFFLLQTLTAISIGSAFIWTFLTIWWLRAATIILLALLFANWSYRKLPIRLTGSAVGLLLWSVGLMTMNLVAWGALRP